MGGLAFDGCSRSSPSLSTVPSVSCTLQLCKRNAPLATNASANTLSLIVRRKAPDSTFVHVKTDIIIFSILDAAGLAVMINGTVFGFPFYGFVSAVVSYIQVFLVCRHSAAATGAGR